MQGFIVTVCAARFDATIVALSRRPARGEAKLRMAVRDGLDNALASVKTLYTGANTGKLLLRVAAP